MKALASPLLLLVALFFAVLPMSVSADPRANAMHATCVERMRAGSCAALSPVEAYTPEQLSAPVLLIGIGRVSFRDFLAVRGSGSIDPSDTRMCDVAAAACRGDWNSPRCMVGRYLWDQP